MLLESIEYNHLPGTPSVWRLKGCTLGNINLIVGKNATGKTKTLKVIHALADLLCGDTKLTFLSGNYKVIFDSNGSKTKYYLSYDNNRIVQERLIIDSKSYLSRGHGGKGWIRYQKLIKGPGKLEFQISDNELAVFARRDMIQHPFLENLYSWGKSVTYYRFGGQLGQDHMLLSVPSETEKTAQTKLNIKDTTKVVEIFKQGDKEFGKKFTDTIITDMKKVGYRLKDIGICTPDSIIVQTPLPGSLLGIYVQEGDLKAKTDQNEISQGMFRALSLIIQINYSQLAQTPSCILIDDIGEGLDYERSSALVKLLVKKAEGKSIQLIMATNDRFVMNNVPLEYWSLIQRIGGTSRIHNFRNSRELFENFELTGLNNFDFFSTKYYLKRQLH